MTTVEQWAVARRAALDHVLGLVAAAPWSDSVVLRGSMAMVAWVGDAAREPGDLDFVVVPSQAVSIDRLAPYPYVASLDAVRHTPEAVHGAVTDEIWDDGEAAWETGGMRAVLAPEGLSWELECTPGPRPFDGLVEEVRARPEAAFGVVLDPDAVQVESLGGGYRGDGGDAYDGYDGVGGYALAGTRFRLPWSAAGLPPGEVQVDFAEDERLPEPPVWTLVPRMDGAEPTVVRTASRALSLAWKVVWLCRDAAAGRQSQPKDLYDAVLLAEAEDGAASSMVVRRVLRLSGVEVAALAAGVPRPTEGAWAAFRAEHPKVRGTAAEWGRRLAVRLAPVLDKETQGG